MPRNTPTTSDAATTVNASSSDGRAPWASWASTSQPEMSVPNGCARPKPCGCSLATAMSQCCGLTAVITCGNAATKMKNSVITNAMITSGRRSILPATPDHMPWPSPTWDSTSRSTAIASSGLVTSVIADPRIEGGIGQVDQQHHPDDDDGQDGGHPDHHPDVTLLHRLPQQVAHPADVHHTLCDHRAGERVGEDEAERGDHRDRGVPDDVEAGDVGVAQ